MSYKASRLAHRIGCLPLSGLTSSASGLAVAGVAESLVLARRTMSTGVVKGLNILKNGQDPEEMKDEDVPDWLRELGRHGAGQTLQELERKAELTSQEARQATKLRNREKIKRANSLSAK